MTGPDVEKLRRLRDCAEPFSPVFGHGLGAVKEGLLAARSFIDAWITLIDRAQAPAAEGAAASDAGAQKVDVQ